jgi:murein DD-endopeptidase MepM/ murein hydrolase activator NlpD
MVTVVGAAEFQVGANIAPLRTGLAEGEQAARSGSAKISTAISGELKKSEEAARRAGEGIKRGLEIGGAIAGVTLGIEGLRAGLEKVVEVTKATEQVQLGLNRTYGAGAQQFVEFSKQQAAATGQSALGFQKAAAEARSLATNYGLTNQQIQELIKRSADLGAISGKDTADAFHRIESALRGEGEAAEALGLSLNSNAVKAFGNMTAEQRKNFESLDQVTKAQIIYDELMRQSAADVGSAAAQSNTLTGALNKAEASGIKLAQAIGEKITPAVIDLGKSIDPTVAAILALIGTIERLNNIKIAVPKVQGPSLFEQIFGRRFGEAGADTLIGPGGSLIDTNNPDGRPNNPNIQVGPDAGLPGSGAGPTADQASAAAAAQEDDRIRRAKQLAAEEAAKRAAKAALEQRKHDVDERVKVELDGIAKEKQAAERAYQDQRAILEQRKDAEIKAASDAHDATVKAIEDEARQVARGFEQEIAAAEHARDERLRAAEQTHQDAVRAIEAEAQATKDAADEQIRQAEIARDKRKQTATDTRDAAIKSLDDEKQARQDARTLEDRAESDYTENVKRQIADRYEAEQRAIQDDVTAVQKSSERKIRSIEAEAQAAQRAGERRARAIEKEAQAENDRHQHALDGIQKELDAALEAVDRESTAQLAAIEAERDARADVLDEQLKQLDAQLKATDAQEKQAEAAERLAGLQDRVTQAQQNLARIQGSGDQAAAQSAQQALQSAVRRGDRLAAESARSALDQALGTGNPADIEKAQQELAAAQKAVLDEQTKQADDARKNQLQNERDSLKDQIDAEKDAFKTRVDSEKTALREQADARKQALQDDAAARKDAETAENESRKRSLDAEKQAADDKTKANVDSLNKRKQAISDATKTEVDHINERKRAIQDEHDDAVRLADDQAKGRKRTLEDTRRAEDEADKAKREQIQTTYATEQHAIKATYDDEETGLIPALHRASDAAQREYGTRKQAADDAYAAEQQSIRDTSEQAITALRTQAQEAADRFKDRKQAADDAYTDEQRQIKATYDDPGGLLDRLEKSKQATIDALDAQVEKWQKWGTDVKKEIKDATDDLDKFIEKAGGLDQIGVRVDAKPGEPGGPSGPAIPHGFPGGAGSSASVPAPYSVTFPFDAPYGGPFAGGAAWPGGPPRHRGIDLALPGGDNGRGTPYGAFQAGRVVALIPESQDPAGGNGIIIQTKDGLYNYYGHNDRFLVEQGDTVEAGQKIGVLGRSGLDAGQQTHLHYEVRRGINGDPIGSTIDPVPYMSGGGSPSDGGVDEITVTVQGRQITFQRKGGGDFVGPNGDDNPEFQRLLAAARSAAREYDLPASIMAAIPINEGRFSELQTKYHNIFSIKGEGPAGSVTLPTDEIINGQRVTVNDAFRVYHDDSESFKDFGKLITKSGIYDDAVSAWRSHHDVTEFMNLLGRHYATDPNFPRQVLKIAGYAGGTVIREPTLMAGLRTGSLGIAGETGQPERLLGTAATARYGSGDNFTYYGVAPEDVFSQFRRDQRTRQILRGARR